MRKVLFISFFLVLLLCSCIKEKQTGADLAAGDKVPDFTVVMNDGNSVTGEQLRQGASCIVFFTTMCPDCRNALPHIKAIYEEFVPQGVQFALISREESGGSIAGYWAEHGFTMPYSAQEDRSIYELFAQSRVPRIYICSNGVIKAIFTDVPAPTYDSMATELNNIIH